MILVIVGPTGSGKTKLSIELAKKLNGEIINGDSTQIYRTLDIATAKVKESEKENIPHHLFDIKNIEEDYTVYDYQKDARNVINDILKRKKTPIIVGGTGLYIKAALYDYDFKEESKKGDYSSLSDYELYQKNLKIDPTLNIHPNNRKRLERFLDYYDNHQEAITSKEKTDKILYDVLFIGLTMEREVLYGRLNKRVDQMLQAGLIKEAKALYDSNIRTKAVLTPIGYKELFTYFEGHTSLEDALELIKKKTRNYAKRQYTWFKHQVPTKWFNVNLDNFDETILEVLNYIKTEIFKKAV